MNYSDFSFWWILILFSVPFFTVRAIAKSLNLWRGFFDGIGLLVVSLFLFFDASHQSFTIFIFQVIFNYLMVALMLRLEGWKAKLVGTLLIIFDVSVLAYFKYLIFFVDHILDRIIHISPEWQAGFPLLRKDYIPPGVSFYTFEMIAFTVDSLNSKRKKPINFLDYVNFMAFFPKVVAGPIERRLNLLPQLENFRFKFTVENFDKGLRWLSLGVFMKFVLGDNLSTYIDLSNTNNPWIIWFITFLFTLRIYFDFAGYSFIAVGLAWFLGIKLTVNFLAPYTSVSINEFWQRWHITLSTWFRDYVFVPLMGSKKEWAAFFLFITFTLSGFWHGAAFNFIIWGAYHGALLLVLRYIGRPFHKLLGKYLSRSEFISWGLTFFSVTFGCLFFVETNTHNLITKLKTLFTPWSYSLSNLEKLFTSYSLNEGILLGIIVALSIGILLMEHIAVWKNKYEYELLLSNWVSPLLLALTILLAANTPSQFIYFEF